jgi:hypothetical protein
MPLLCLTMDATFSSLRGAVVVQSNYVERGAHQIWYRWATDLSVDDQFLTDCLQYICCMF